MQTRIISAAFMIIALVILGIANWYYVNLAVFSLLLFLAVNEANLLFKTNTSAFFVTLAFIISALLPHPIISALSMICLFAGYLAYAQKNISNIFAFIYPFIPFIALWQLLDNEGMRIFVWLLIIVGVCDSLAYFTGKSFGKTSFCPTSPNKTLEGLIGGFASSIIAGSIYGVFFLSMDILKLALISGFVAIFAIIGDLIESYLKRIAGVKDSGSLIPGHGGVLDRLDAALIAAIAMLVVL